MAFSKIVRRVRERTSEIMEEVRQAVIEEREREEKIARGIVHSAKIINGTKCSAAIHKRLILTFAPPPDQIQVELDRKTCVGTTGRNGTTPRLGAWFCPSDSLIYGARFAGCASNADDGIRLAFRLVRKGLLLVAINGRSVEGLKFDLAVDTLKQARWPLLLRFAKDVFTDQRLAPAIQDGELGDPDAEHDVDEFEGNVCEHEDEDEQSESYEEEDGEEKYGGGKFARTQARGQMNKPTKERRAFMKLLAREDAYFHVMKVPFTRTHLNAFFRSIAEEDLAYFLQRLKSGQNLCVRNDLGQTPLIIAAGAPTQAMLLCEHLLREGVSVDEPDTNNGLTALGVAACNGNVDVIKLLVGAGADINWEDAFARTPLMLATKNEQFECVKFLLEKRARVTHVELSSGWACLHHCAQSGRVDILKLLAFTDGCDLHAKTLPAPFRFPRTALEIAREAGNVDAAAFLHERLAAEPLHRIWPYASEWVVNDVTSHVADLMWRVGQHFVDFRLGECQARATAVNKLLKYRKAQPVGRHSVEERNAREESVFEQKEEPIQGEIWLGSMEAVSAKWASNEGMCGKSMDKLLLWNGDDKAWACKLKEEPWLEKGFRDTLVLHDGLDSFEAFAKKHLSKAVKFIIEALNNGERVLVADSANSVEDQLLFPTVVATCALIIREEMHYEEIAKIMQQRCYFYTVEQASKKAEFALQRSTLNGELNEKQLLLIMIAHDCVIEEGKRRTAIPEGEWLTGVIALDDKVHKRLLQRTRRKQTTFATTFII